MPTWVLQQRAEGLLERMDDPACDAEQLRNTYRHFRLVNTLFSNWRWLYTRYLRPHCQGPTSLLDIGCGGGDVVRQLARWALQDGLDLSITAIDPDRRALAYAQSQTALKIHFRQARAETLRLEAKRFDLVISNHLLHHLSDSEVVELCRVSEQLATGLVLHNDIRRSDLAYLGFGLTGPFFKDSFVTEDGLTSIRRSFTPQELGRIVPAGWSVKPQLPYRNLLLYRP